MVCYGISGVVNCIVFQPFSFCLFLYCIWLACTLVRELLFTLNIVTNFTHFWLQNPKKDGDIKFKFTKFPVRKSEETKQEDANWTTVK